MPPNLPARRTRAAVRAADAAVQLAAAESVHEVRAAAVAANTRAAYAGQWNLFAAWCAEHGHAALPAADFTVAAYLTHRFNAGKAIQTLSLGWAAIRRVHRDAGLNPPNGHELHETMAGLKRSAAERGTAATRGQAPPITWRQADDMAKAAARDGIPGLRDAAIIAVMSDGLLRIGECAALDVADIEPAIADTLLVRRSKTDPTGQGVPLPLRRSTVRRIRAWQAAAGIRAGALFRRIRRGGRVQPQRLDRKAIPVILRRRAAAVGIEGIVRGHSLRVGSAVSFAEKGASLVEMQTAGRWSSPNMPGRYARDVIARREGPLRKYRGR